MIPKIYTATSLTVFLDNSSHTVYKTEAKYADFSAAIESGDFLKARQLLGSSSVLKAYSKGSIVVTDGEVVLDGKKLHNAITERVLSLFKDGKSYDYMLAFLRRIQANTSPTAVEELYLFLEKAQIPITPDGHFLAYRKVDSDFNSFHPNPDGTKNSNKVGETVFMDRKLVDANRNETCSKGLHFCSFSYLSSYHGGSGKVVIVKIDPADVVSIPSDYSNSKGRCCKYIVVAEHLPKEQQEAYKDVSLANPDGTVHTGKDIDPSQIKFGEISQPKNLTSKKIVGYLRSKIDSNKKPTLRQLQSTLSPVTPTIASLAKTIVKLGFKLQQNSVLSKSVVTD